ncbi:hypothetical protein G6F56_004539 [Rhizopus delemar]|nr:hypothetical protein G6F56_004539 [Rhizopus delemar]
MVSIFRVIRENNVQVLNQLIGLATGEVSISHYNNNYLSKEDLLNLQQQLKTTGSKFVDFNRKSSNGRTALHVAATWNRVEIVQLLVDCPLVNVNLQDRENGWTALHRALFMGNVDIARILLGRQDIDLSIKDREGFRAFEVYDSTIPDAFPSKIMLKNNQKAIDESQIEVDEIEAHVSADKRYFSTGGTDVYTWGQNTNYVLGQPDSENRSRPERIHFQLDSQQNPAVTKRPAYVIESVAMAKYHMTILTSESSNNLLVCGFGRGGRLGLGKDADTQLVPTPVLWSEKIVSVAPGRDHTIALTESGVVISFGSNEFGQLGYEIESSKKKDEVPMQHKPKKIQAQNLKKQHIIGVAASRIHSVVYTDFDLFTFGLNQGQLGYHQSDSNESCQITPRKVSMSMEIQQVVANDNATVVLNKFHEVILLCNYSQQRLLFPSGTQVNRLAVNHIVKLIPSGTEYLGAITSLGDVFIWTCKSLAKSNKTTVSTPKRVWSSSKTYLSAIDASLGQYGEIIVCTVSGHVFLGQPDGNSYKFKEIPYIQRCISVCANSSGAFAAIRAEYLLQPTEVMPSTIKYDICHSLPYMWIKEELQKEIDGLTAQMTVTKPNISDEDNTKNFEQQEIRNEFENLVNIAVDNAWKRIETVSNKDEILDTVFVVQDRKIYCHSSILACRGLMFKHMIDTVDKNVGYIDISLTKRQDNRTEIHIGNCELTSLLLMVDYIYMDEYEHPMKVFFRPPALCGIVDVKKIQRDLVALAEIFRLPHLLSSAQSSFNHQPVPSFVSDLNNLIGHHQPNILLKTKDRDILCHEVILRHRCAFFYNLLSPQSFWVSHRRKQQKILEVDLQHMSSDVAETIIQFIYLDSEEYSLFDNIEKCTEEAMLYFLLDLLCEADALMIERLKSIVEKTLVRFIKLRTVSTIIEHANAYWANSLKNTCMVFIKANLPVFLSLSTDITDPSEVEDDEFSTSIYALSLGDGSNIGNFVETLVTLHPEKSSPVMKPQESFQKPKKTVHEPFEDSVQSATPYSWVANAENVIEPSLRNILEETHPMENSTLKTPKSTTPKKISQKERRKTSLQLQESSSSLPVKPVWGKVTSEPIISLTKVIEKDEEQNTKSSKGKIVYIPEEDLLNVPRETKHPNKEKKMIYNPIESIGSTFRLTPIRRSANTSNQTDSSSNIQSFKTIQNQQLEDYKLKNTKPKKNLTRIQKEEQAIAGLEQYYIQTLNIMSGEWCEVQRIV